LHVTLEELASNVMNFGTQEIDYKCVLVVLHGQKIN